MGIFDDISVALGGNFGSAKDDLMNESSQRFGDLVPEEVQDLPETQQPFGEDTPAQDEENEEE